MLTVDERFERFWGPSTIKPLNFNYDFQPNFTGQNIWTLTDNLFVPKSKQEQDGGSKKNSWKKARRQRSSGYRQFPTIDQDCRQKSSSAQGSYISRRLKIVSSPLSDSSQKSLAALPKSPKAAQAGPKEATARSVKTKKQLLTTPKRVFSRKRPVGTPKYLQKSKAPQSGLTLKLSQQETERLLKSLDFKVRTVKKAKQRDRSKSEALINEKRPIRVGNPKKSSQSRPLSNKARQPTMKASDNLPTKASRVSSSSGKNSQSSSGLNELVGPLPRVNFTSVRDAVQPKKSSSSSLKKKSSEKSGVSDIKGSKTSTNSRKNKIPSEFQQDFSLAPLTEELDTSQQKIKTTRVKIIPKLTLNNQLLKSTTPKIENKQVDKKLIPKVPPKKREPRKIDSVLWTPDKVALLDQITDDQQLKAVLMSAGDTYMKTKKYFSVKSNLKTKPPMKPSVMGVNREASDNKKVSPAAVPAKPPGKKLVKDQPASSSREAAKEEKSVASDTLEESQATMSSKPEKNKGAAELSAVATKKVEPKRVTNNQLLKTDGAPRTVRTPKLPAKKFNMNRPQLLKDNKVTNVVAAKKRPKYTINSRQVRKVEEKLAQLSAEVTGNSPKAQEKKAAQVQHSNIKQLRKIIDKSLFKFKDDNMGELRSD